MRQYIKNNKIYTIPIIIHKRNKTIYTTDHEVILENGYKEYIPQEEEVQLSIEQQIEISNNEINKQTDQKILNNFSYKGNPIYLTTENQINFANMYIAKDKLTYPITIKTQFGFMELQTAEDVEEFYLEGLNFIKQCLEEGWTAKAIAEQEIRNK